MAGGEMTKRDNLKTKTPLTICIYARSHVPNAVDVSRDSRCWRFQFDRAAAEPGPSVPQCLPEPAYPDFHQPWLLHSARIRLPAAHVTVARAQLHQPTAAGTGLGTCMCSDVFLKYPHAAQLLCEIRKLPPCVWYGLLKCVPTSGGYKWATRGRKGGGRNHVARRQKKMGFDYETYVCTARYVPAQCWDLFLFYFFAWHTTSWFENRYIT